jgi:cell division protein ZapA
MVTEENGQLIEVMIFGQKYTLKGQGASDDIQDVAGYVDRKMKDISEGTSTVDSLKVAILAALNIADEYQRYRALKEENEGALMQRAEDCCRILEAVMDQE